MRRWNLKTLFSNCLTIISQHIHDYLLIYVNMSKLTLWPILPTQTSTNYLVLKIEISSSHILAFVHELDTIHDILWFLAAQIKILIKDLISRIRYNSNLWKVDTLAAKLRYHSHRRKERKRESTCIKDRYSLHIFHL